MIDNNITIPPDVVEEVATELYERTEYTTMSECRLMAKAAIRLTLAHWPGAYRTDPVLFGSAILLPLPQEPSND